MKQRTAPRWSKTTVGALATVLVAVGLGAAAAVPASATAAHTSASLVAKLTGVDSMNNTYNLWDIKGTDLGIMWDNGSGQVLTAFGDTFGAVWIGPGGGAFGSGTPTGAATCCSDRATATSLTGCPSRVRSPMPTGSPGK